MFTLTLNARLAADFLHNFVKNPCNTYSMTADFFLVLQKNPLRNPSISVNVNTL